MKGHYILFAACLGYATFFGAMADDDAGVARAAVRRASGTNVQATTTSRKKVQPVETSGRASATTTRTTPAQKSTNVTSPRTISTRTAVVSDTTRTTPAQKSTRATVTPRGGISNTPQNRTTVTTGRTAITTTPRATGASHATNARATTTSRVMGASRATNARTTTKTQISRAATNNELRDAIMGRNYTACRQVYNDCMDEFCANKDTQLKRCACSSRLHEFDRVKKSLANVEDQLLDFNQRLLTVNMDKEDAAALFTATEGELAFSKQDTSASKKVLDEISKKLNSNSNDSFNQNLSAITLSLNADAAFDNVDSLMGASTTSKEGVDLYNAALPVCREMAAEVCDEESLKLAESGYQMSIEQDCNTVAKTYETQTDQAREKIREGSALLDISRLDIYQKRNSDDILTCKKKMLDQLSNTSVCGDNLGKCLDMSGRYIDPSTGQAFLTQDLANLSTLITRPEGNQTWTSAPGNKRFIAYLDSKKKYLEPAMENCQDISDYVWDEFIEDALAQIKLAQESKLEEVRQSCTTLTAQCLSETAKSISDFDARALSTFGVKADKTVNDMCSNVRNACTALLETIGDDQDWIGGMSQIATDKTYDTIMQTCREVGRACIIQACKSISGNFGMCESAQNSVNRKSIINRTSCWSEVKQCVADAGEDAINRIFEQVETDTNKYNNGGSFYNELYGKPISDTGWHYSNPNVSTNQAFKDETTQYCYQTDPKDAKGQHCIYDICINECGCDILDNNQQSYIKDETPQHDCQNATSLECRICRLAEKIWGNCEAAPTANIESANSHNQIKIPIDTKTSTLLSWFAQNTGTLKEPDNCRDTSCPSGYAPYIDNTGSVICISEADRSGAGEMCPLSSNNRFTPLWNNSNFTNCCPNTSSNGKTITTDHCYMGDKTISIDDHLMYSSDFNNPQNSNVCISDPTTDAFNIVEYIPLKGPDNMTMDNIKLVCISKSSDKPISADTTTNPDTEYPSGTTIKCDGYFVYVNSDGYHIDPHNQKKFISYIPKNSTACYYNVENGQWEKGDGTPCETPKYWKIDLSALNSTTQP